MEPKISTYRVSIFGFFDLKRRTMSIEEMILKLKEKSIIVEELMSYVSSKENIKSLIMNAAGDEPLIKVNYSLMMDYPYEILKGFSLAMDIFEAEEGVVALKENEKDAAESLEGSLDLFKDVRLEKIKDVFSLWDKEVLAYEVQKDNITQEKKEVLVLTPETCLDIYNAIIDDKVPVDTYLTIGGAVEKTLTVKVPIGLKVKDILVSVGEIKIEDYVILIGGPITGKIGTKESVITKNTKGILIFPKGKKVCQSRKGEYSKLKKQVLSICTQCKMCTMLCPRYQLGYDIQPHKIMSTLMYEANYLDMMGVFSCSHCNLCTLYSCPQDLNPMMIIKNLKIKLQEKGLEDIYKLSELSKNNENSENKENKEMKRKREQRKVSNKLLKQKLGLTEYDREAPLEQIEFVGNNYYIDLNQKKGMKYIPCIKAGEKVLKGRVIARYSTIKDGDIKELSMALYSPINGKVLEISEKYIFIKKGEF
ncbi:MAG: 4Fe-4S dicluster domain-containing protein [Fusobacteriaceae bacterium]